MMRLPAFHAVIDTREDPEIRRQTHPVGQPR